MIITYIYLLIRNHMDTLLAKDDEERIIFYI